MCPHWKWSSDLDKLSGFFNISGVFCFYSFSEKQEENKDTTSISR
jgi:hypothetical protein